MCTCDASTRPCASAQRALEHGDGCVRTHHVRQFFLAKTAALIASGWDEDVGFPDHFHGMWRFRLANLRMLLCDTSVASIAHVKGQRTYELGIGHKSRDVATHYAVALNATIERNSLIHGMTWPAGLAGAVGNAAACAAAVRALHARGACGIGRR